MKNSKIQLPSPSFLTSCKNGAAPGKSVGFCYFLGSNDATKLASIFREHALPWQLKDLKSSQTDIVRFTGRKGPVWILKPLVKNAQSPVSHQGLLEESSFARYRDQAGGFLDACKKAGLEKMQIIFSGTNREQEIAALTGMEMAQYQFRSFYGVPAKTKAKEKKLSVYVQKIEGKNKRPLDKKIFAEARALGNSLNACRHLVNLPPGDLQPTSYSELAKSSFAGSKTTQVTVWNEKKLIQEGMGLLLGVGQGSEFPPCLVHIRYRPKKSSRSKPIAFVGKGITFDTGGLDIKPSSGMRMMKKDMGGSAAVFALALWAEEIGLEVPCDFYLALAENAVDQKSFRPSDVLTARNGMTVEIHNTDAEGRLVLADALDVAVTQKGNDAPEMVINVATLTGAIKVALGAELAGLFCNNDDLAEKLMLAGQRRGDLAWRMPLFKKYFGSSSTPFADFVNSVDGFGGAITAALFLEKFVGNTPWAHLDIYAWNDKTTGALGFAGGNGQGVQALSEFLRELEVNPAWTPQERT